MRGFVDALFTVLEPIRVRYGNVLCAILLPAQAHNHAITQDSDQTNTFLWPQLFSKSEIEFWGTLTPKTKSSCTVEFAVEIYKGI